jgi:prepilin-type N-terminal cleavage/methylation domain-containing protein
VVSLKASSYQRKKRGHFGFTLIELMIVVAIIAILATIAIPKFADMIRKAQEGSSKGSLGAVRSALGIYYADNEGYYPCSGEVPMGGGCMSRLTVNGKYLSVVPVIYLPNYHQSGANEYNIFNANCPDYYGTWPNFDSVGSPGFNYFYLIPGSCYFSNLNSGPGEVFINCTHTDTKGTFWTNY